MSERATGLVLRTRPYSETSLIVHWLTAEAGRLATLAKGARRPKSPLRGKLDLFYLAEFNYQRARRSDLHTLREVVLRATYPVLRADLSRLRLATHCVLLTEQTTEPEAPVPEVYRLLQATLDRLSQSQGHTSPHLAFVFECRLLAELGWRPNPSDRALSPGARQLLELWLAANLDIAWRAQPSAAQTAEFRDYLQRFMLEHLGRVPRGRTAALASTQPMDYS
ncbi:MAG: DNA repair protein RecO [Verrucomicrobia bacterium]|nr:DNA repair protein RecO [Verrucomicrobiota bacterium]